MSTRFVAGSLNRTYEGLKLRFVIFVEIHEYPLNRTYEGLKPRYGSPISTLTLLFEPYL